jgi:hypothetical protein
LYQWGRNDVDHTFRCDYAPPAAGDGSFLAENNHYGSDGVNASAYNPATDTKFVYFSISSGGASGTKPSSGLVWVPVKNGVPSNNWTPSDNLENSNANYGTNNGYALYTSDTWSGIADKDCLTDPNDPEPLMFLPAAGYHFYHIGRVHSTGFEGRYWSSTVGGSTGRTMDFFGSNVYASDYSIMSRAYGLSVRCISE